MQVDNDLLELLLAHICGGDAPSAAGGGEEGRDDESQEQCTVLVFLPGLGSIRKLEEQLRGSSLFSDTRRFEVLALHSSVSARQQAMVFRRVKRGAQRIVLSTNIAETGVTIPSVTVVVDSGKMKEQI